MSFVPEDGTGLSTANSFCETAFADTYFADRGVTAWDELGAPIKEYLLIKATDYVNLRFEWRGYKATAEQALEWPRNEAYDDQGRVLSGVPTNLAKATAEYALRALSADLAPDLTYEDTNQLVKEKTEIVGPITETVKYVDGLPPTSFRNYPAVDVLLRPLTYSKRFWRR